MRDTTKDDKIHGNRNTYGFERGDRLLYIPSAGVSMTVEVVRAYKYTCKVRVLSTGEVFTEVNYAFCPNEEK